MSALDPWYLDNLVCPVDRSALRLEGEELVSEGGRRYPVVDGVPVMLVGEARQTLHVATSAMARGRKDGALVDERAPNFYLESLGISEDEKKQLLELWRTGKAKIDPVALLMQGATSGSPYAHLIGNAALDSYPIPAIRLPPARNNEVMVDVGCGWGRWSIAAARKGYRVISVDPSMGALMAARRIARELGQTIHGIVGDGRYLPLRDRSVDVAYSFGVLQHLAKEDVRATLDSMARVVKPRGTVQVQMAAAWGIRSLQQQMRRGFREPKNFEVRYWTVPELKSAFTKAIGDTRVSVDCYFGLGWQWSDYGYMTARNKPILITSEVLRRMSLALPPMRYLADSVYCTSTKRV